MIGEALNKHWKPPTPPFMQQLEGGGAKARTAIHVIFICVIGFV